MNQGLSTNTELGSSIGKGRNSSTLKQENPKYFTFLTGLVQGNMPPTFSDTGWLNVARRFGLSVEEAQAFADKFISEGGSYEAS